MQQRAGGDSSSENLLARWVNGRETKKNKSEAFGNGEIEATFRTREPLLSQEKHPDAFCCLTEASADGQIQTDAGKAQQMQSDIMHTLQIRLVDTKMK